MGINGTEKARQGIELLTEEVLQETKETLEDNLSLDKETRKMILGVAEYTMENLAEVLTLMRNYFMPEDHTERFESLRTKYNVKRAELNSIYGLNISELK